MSLEAIRVGIATAVNTRVQAFTAYPLQVEYDNRIVVDTRTQVNPYLKVNTLLLDGHQVNLSDDPTHRTVGQLHLIAAVKAGSGCRPANELLDFFYPALQRKNFNGVRTLMCTFTKPFEKSGWDCYAVIIPFWYDTTYGA